MMLAYSAYLSLSGPNMRSLIMPEKPMIALSGVRSSWLMFARNSDFARLAASAVSFAAQFLKRTARAQDVADAVVEDEPIQGLRNEIRRACIVGASNRRHVIEARR